MKEFLQLMRRFVSPYKRYIGWAIVLNVLSAIFNVFSFTLLIPILNILFKTGENTKVYEYMEWGSEGIKEVAVNNFYYYVTQMIETHGPQMTLLFMGLFLAFMTMLKTSCYFGHYDSPSYGSGTRYPRDGLFQSDALAARLFL